MTVRIPNDTNERYVAHAFDLALSRLDSGRILRSDAIDPWGVIDRYHEPHRKYHGLPHIVHMLDSLRQLCRSNDLGGYYANPTVVLAAIYHDCVYEVGSKAPANEYESSFVMRDELKAILPGYIVREISQLILATRMRTYTQEPFTLNEALLRDADLAGFAASWEVCSSNAEKIKGELCVPGKEAEFFEGRVKFLQFMLDLPQIMWYPHNRDAREQRARENIGHELHQISTR
jgi:predicted metal-dependent HD superfamily phosphohydrolase